MSRAEATTTRRSRMARDYAAFPPPNGARWSVYRKAQRPRRVTENILVGFGARLGRLRSSSVPLRVLCVRGKSYYRTLPPAVGFLQAQADVCGHGHGEPRPAGVARKKALTPVARREAVDGGGMIEWADGAGGRRPCQGRQRARTPYPRALDKLTFAGRISHEGTALFPLPPPGISVCLRDAPHRRCRACPCLGFRARRRRTGRRAEFHRHLLR